MGTPYRNQSYGPPQMSRLTPAVKWLLIVNTGLFVVSFLAAQTSFSGIFLPFSLIPNWVLTKFAAWQLVTYMFLHSPNSFMHILVNMLSLWMFGTPLESVWGTRRFLKFYFYSGIAAGILVVVLNTMMGFGNTRTIGASGAVYALLAAFGMLFPKVPIYFFGIFPIQARLFVWIDGAIVFLSSITAAGGGVSHFAHLGGLVFGLAYVRFGMGGSRGSVRMARRRSLADRLTDWYREWKLRRAKKKFQVYLKKQGTRPDDWVN